MRPLAALLILAACNTAGPQFRGLTATRITVAGSVFDVRIRGDLAEAIRVNSQYAPRFGPIRARAAFAMERVSGCAVRSVTGDQAVALGKLACKDRPDHWPPPATAYSCVEIATWTRGDAWREFECDPIP
ncbi:MAG: hypothetical protein KDK24_15805 [Pseudooceanicola sp.]|nr:hypothetical protein [Pseudooceanicola sp.]